MNRNAWQLFSNDLDLAIATLESARQKTLSVETTASICQVNTFFGNFKNVQEILLGSEEDVRRTNYGRGALLRIRQYHRNTNHWLSLCLTEQKEWFNQISKLFESRNQIIEVNPGGGLGDMLEALATLQAADAQTRKRIKFVVPTHARQAITPFLQHHQNHHRLRWTNEKENINSQ